VKHRVGGGRGTDEKGVGWRRQRHSPVVGWREAEQEETLVSGGGVGWRMQWREVEWATGGREGGTRSIGQDGGGGEVRAGGVGLNGRADG
jgi:hypothetical protein